MTTGPMVGTFMAGLHGEASHQTAARSWVMWAPTGLGNCLYSFKAEFEAIQILYT